MANTKISFDEFNKYMIAIEDVCKLQDDIDKVVRKFNYKSKSMAELYFPTLIVETISLLSMLVGDVCNWIDYWVFELDFGKKYTVGCVTDENGDNISLNTIEDLWNLIQTENQQNTCSCQ